MKKVIYLINENGTVLYFFPSSGKNKYSGNNLNLSCQTTKRGGKGDREYIPQIIPCKLLDSFLMAWHSPANINKILAERGYELENFNEKFSNIEEGLLLILKERATHKGVSFLFTEEDKKKIIAKISELKANFSSKKSELDNLDNELSAELSKIKELEDLNNALLNKEILDSKAFQQNALKIAKIKHSNKTKIDKRNLLFVECEKLEKELNSLEKHLKELESV